MIKQTRLLYLSFKEFEYIQVSQDQMNSLLKFFHENGKLARTQKIRKEWSIPLLYREEICGNYIQLYCRDRDYRLRCYSTNFVDPDKYRNTDEKKRFYAGEEAVKLVEGRLFERTGKNLKEIFGYCDPEIQDCVPRSLIWLNEKYTYKTYKNASLADISSNFPFNSCGKLPDASRAIKKSGLIRPTKEYPFAFYIKSHHCAEYRRFDTRKWMTTEFAFTLSHDRKLAEKYYFVDEKDEETVLMPAAEFEITPEMEYFYAQKMNGNSEAKLVMNAFIGKLHPAVPSVKNAILMYHVAAIILGRATQQILDIINDVKFAGGMPLMIQTDSIIYLHPTYKAGVEKKVFGALVQEIYKKNFRMVAIGQYAFCDTDGKILMVKHQGISDNGLINIEKIEDIDKWKNAEITIFDMTKKEFVKVKSTGRLFL